MRKIGIASTLILFLCAGGISLTGCGGNPDEELVAKVGDAKILAKDLNEAFQQTSGRFVTFDDELRRRQALLDTLIIQQLLIQEAYKHNIDDLEEVNRLVLANKDKFLLDILYLREIEDKAVIKEDELKDWYEKLEYKYKASHILFRSEDTALMVLDSLQKGGIFEDLALRFSVDPSAQRNRGDLGFFAWGQMLPSFQDAVYKMKPGEISKPFKTRFGWHIVKMVEKIPNEERRSYESILDQMETAAKNTKKGVLLEAYNDSLRARYPVTVDKATVEYVFHKRDILYPPQVIATLPRNDFDLNQLDRNDKELVLASWDGGQMTLGEYLVQVQNPMVKQNMRIPNLDDYEGLAEFIFQLNVMDLLAAEARRKGLENDPEYLRKIKKFKELAMADIMQNDSLPLGEAVDEGQMRQYYEDNIDEFREEPSIHVHEILLSSEADAVKYRKQIRTFNEFKDVAARVTERPGKREVQGDLGYIKLKYFPDLYSEADRASLGSVAGPIKMANGKFSLVYIVDKKAEELKDFSMVRRQINDKLEKERRHKAFSDWVDGKKKEVSVEIFENNVRATVDKDKYAAPDSVTRG